MESLDRDGVRLAFEAHGHGERGIVFVHGWCCDHTFFEPQVEFFGHEYRVITMDLRGHGESDKPIQSYHPDIFAEDINWIIGKTGLARPIVVGHSMGGVIALRLAHLHPEAVSALVGLDAAWVLLPEAAALCPVVANRLLKDNYQEVLRELMGGLFLETDDKERRERILDIMTSVRQDIMISAWRERSEKTDTDTPLRHLQMPTLYIAAENRMVDLQAIRTLDTVAMGQTVGSGHFHQLECPDQINAMIARFLSINGLAPG